MSHEYRYREAEAHILRLVESGGLIPGDRLPSLRRLASRLRLSLATVGQAYSELEAKGIICAKPRSGYFLNSPQIKLALPDKLKSDSSPSEVTKSGLIRMVLDRNLGRTDLVPLGISTPSSDLLPISGLAKAMAQALKEERWRAADYQNVRGLPELRAEIAKRSADAGQTISPEQVVVTGGTVEALNLALRAITRPGDPVLIQSPTYYCLLQLLETLGLRAIEIPSCPEQGLSVEDVDRALRKFSVRAMVLIPNFNNPDGALMPDEIKREIVRLAASKDIPIIEDDIYGELHFGPERPRVLGAFDRDARVVTCSSFSKTLAPGYRVGWIVPGRYLDKVVELKTTTNVCTPTPNQLAVARFLHGGGYERSMGRLRETLARQMEGLRRSVEKYFPVGTKATNPRGGAALWLELPGSPDGVEFFHRAVDMGISVCPGAIFSSQDRYNSFIRLCGGFAWDERAEGAVRMLGELAEELSGEAATVA